MEEKGLNEKVVNNFAEGSNCQVFNGNISGCVFAMPGSTVTQQAGVATAEVQDAPPTERNVPECLRTEKAATLWQKAQAQGWVDEGWQPLLSRPLSALLADRMAEVLGIASKWKVFEQLWHRKNMRNDYNTALDQQQCDDYMKKIKRIIA